MSLPIQKALEEFENSLAVVKGHRPSPRGGGHVQARIRMANLALLANRRALFASYRPRLFRCLAIASGIFCVLFLFAIVLAPLTNQVVVRVMMPPPTRTVVLEEVLLEPPPVSQEAALEQINTPQVVDQPETAEPPVAEAVPEPVIPRRREARELDPDAAKKGRERAREATEKLASATAALDRSLNDLSSTLRTPTSGVSEPVRRRTRGVRSGRSDGQLSAVETGVASGGASADLGGSKVEGSLVAIEALAPSRVEPGRASGEAARSAGAAPGVYRSNASLLAVIQRYAAGIQYCYGTELKRDPSLKGKLVVALTVAASGAVAEATVVQNTVGSERLAACALSQIKDWEFPAIAEGVTTFQAPFVFTPPN